jgi:arginyl-tRNA synthetase
LLLKELRERLLKEIRKTFLVPGKKANYKELRPGKIDLSGITVSEPKNKSFGDISTNAAMVLAPVLKENPMEIAEILQKEIISQWEEVEDISIASPGFINFFLAGEFIRKALSGIASKNEDYGKNDSGKKIRVQIEFVSANPTGSLHIGHGRWAALGDSLCNIYEANGYDVWREYYVNDYGSQINKFAECVASLYLQNFGVQALYPGEGYPEELVKTVVDEIIEKNGANFLAGEPGKVDQEAIGREGIRIMVKRIASTLLSMGVDFDQWFYESWLYEDSNFEDTISRLEKEGTVYSMDDALWFKTEEYGDDKDRVVIRSGGEPTYFASDIMYFMNKAGRGFKKLIYILGADHHGYIKRLKAIAKAAGFKEKNIEIIIGQLVRLVKKGKAVKMSKRKGEVYSLGDLVDEVGSDAVRFFFSANSFDTPMDFDIELAKQKSNQNPVYYVQYAHARISSVFNKVKEMYIAGELKVEENENLADILADIQDMDKACKRLAESMDFKDTSFKDDEDISLAKTFMFYPDIIFDSCENNAPYLVNQYLYRLASEFHYFYNHCRIIDEGKLSTDRFKLILLTRIVLKNALDILKISAPQKM